MTPDELAGLVELWIKTTYATGISWLERDGGTVTVEWVDESSTQITIAVRNTGPKADA